MSNESTTERNFVIHPSFRFWTFLIFNIISLGVSILALHSMLTNKNVRQQLINHVIIVLLVLGVIYELTDIPWILHYNRTGVPMFTSTTFYIIWACLDYALYSLQIALFAWATIERHIIIFHGTWMSTKVRRLFLHYGPIVGIIFYYLTYYSIVHFVPFCEHYFDDFLAGGIFIPCTFDRTVLGSWELIVHQVVPTLIIVVFSIGLVVRVIYQKRTMNRTVQWRRHRKMTVQLILMSTIYVVFNAPWALVIFAFFYGVPAETVSVPLVYTAYLYYYVIFLFPIATSIAFPEIQSRFKKIFCRHRAQTQVGPVTLETLRKTVKPNSQQ